MHKPSAYGLIAFCPWCGSKLVYIETSIDHVKSCPTFMSHTVSLNREYAEDESLLVLNIREVPLDELGPGCWRNGS